MNSIKNIVQSIPLPIGQILANIPYRYRPFIGVAYRRHQKLASDFETWQIKTKKTFILEKLKFITQYAYNNIPFYHDLYLKNNFKPDQLLKYEDIQKIPIITKEMLKEIPLEKRSAKIFGRYPTNTGGSSGSTLNFYITTSLIPKEWAHMHLIWRKLGYRENLLKLCFAGGTLTGKNILYDGLRHHFSVNVYNHLDKVANDLLKLCQKHPISYLHGYPSAIYEFASYCEKSCPELVSSLKKSLKGAFLSSEYPVPNWRTKIENIFGIPSISWYGHTERAILAWEKNRQFIYYPFQTYGFCEAIINNIQDNKTHLIGTTYDNLASPLIRYDTQDSIEIVDMEDELLRSFRIKDGRIGEYVLDKQEVKIPLTALIFGRHHRIFNIAKFIQVSQNMPGEITILVTLSDEIKTPEKWEDWFDTTGINISFNYKRLKKPVLTPMGKLTLKVSKEV